jgi:hypothetical protein
MKRRHFLGGLAVTAWPRHLGQVEQPGRVFEVRHFGAAGDGRTDDTGAIRRAVAEAGKAGGIVHFPAGDRTWRWLVSQARFTCARSGFQPLIVRRGRNPAHRVADGACDAAAY